MAPFFIFFFTLLVFSTGIAGVIFRFKMRTYSGTPHPYHRERMYHRQFPQVEKVDWMKDGF